MTQEEMQREIDALREIANRQASQLAEQEQTIAAQQQALDGAAEWGGELMAQNIALKQELASTMTAIERAKQCLALAHWVMLRMDMGRRVADKVVA